MITSITVITSIISTSIIMITVITFPLLLPHILLHDVDRLDRQVAFSVHPLELPDVFLGVRVALGEANQPVDRFIDYGEQFLDVF
jgi:hypothetical protein